MARYRRKSKIEYAMIVDGKPHFQGDDGVWRDTDVPWGFPHRWEEIDEAAEEALVEKAAEEIYEFAYDFSGDFALELPKDVARRIIALVRGE